MKLSSWLLVRPQCTAAHVPLDLAAAGCLGMAPLTSSSCYATSCCAHLQLRAHDRPSPGWQTPVIMMANCISVAGLNSCPWAMKVTHCGGACMTCARELAPELHPHVAVLMTRPRGGHWTRTVRPLESGQGPHGSRAASTRGTRMQMAVHKRTVGDFRPSDGQVDTSYPQPTESCTITPKARSPVWGGCNPSIVRLEASE